MLTPFRELLDERRAAGAAAGAFTCYDVTTALGVVEAAETRRSGRTPSPRPPLRRPAAYFRLLPRTRPDLCVQLDHVVDDALIDEALAGGIGR